MDNLKQEIFDSFDFSLGFWTNCENYLVDLEKREKENPDLYTIPTEAIEEVFEEIYQSCYGRDNQQVQNLTLFNELIEYTDNGFVFGTDKKGYYVLFSATQGITFSKTSYNRFKQKYSLSDITRARLYCMVNDHSRPDDNFINELKKLNFKWKKILLMNSLRIHSRFPEISL